MESAEERRLEGLSPFELKHKLVQLARDRGERLLLNAARGNPNWIALAPRQAFFQLGRFALQESERRGLRAGLGGAPERAGALERFEQWSARHAGEPGMDLLRQGFSYAIGGLRLDGDDFVHELADGILGGHYPTPGRFLPCCERVVHAALEREVLRGAPAGRFDLFATEGASAAIHYVFDSLAHAHLLEKGDAIALGVPIFTPYIEVPRLRDYQLVEVEVLQDEAGGWQYPARELDKLLDPRVKAFLVVNPSNPTSVAIDAGCAARIGALVASHRPDLIIITDDVYATFPEYYVSLAALAPRNTILIYSWSKAWGTTGWRLGLIALHQDNVLDRRIAAMPADLQDEFRARYASIAADPARLRLIDRMLADSRAVGLNHTAGLSCPQQVQMTLLSLCALVDCAGQYHAAVRDIVTSRHRALCAGAGLEPGTDPCCAHYYATIDVPALARRRHGDEFAEWLLANHAPIDFVVRLAEERGVVLMDGGGFEAPRMSVRVSLANLPDADYEPIGRAIVDLIDDYRDRWLAALRRGGVPA